MVMPVEFAVKCETHEGFLHTLRRGFASRDDAEDYPVRLATWKRVWVEEITPKPVKSAVPVLPPLPWDWVAAGMKGNRNYYSAYLVDANGRKIAAIWGSIGERPLIAEHILHAVNNDGAEDGELLPPPSEVAYGEIDAAGAVFASTPSKTSP